MKTEQRVRACDELSMAATRLKLLDNNSMDREDQIILLENEVQLVPCLAHHLYLHPSYIL